LPSAAPIHTRIQRVWTAGNERVLGTLTLRITAETVTARGQYVARDNVDRQPPKAHDQVLRKFGSTLAAHPLTSVAFPRNSSLSVLTIGRHPSDLREAGGHGYVG
jgi:hypothetical protein